MQRMIRVFFGRDANTLLSSGLLALLLISYVALVYVAVSVGGAFLLGGVSHSTISPPWWLSLLAVALIVLSLVPVSRWFRYRINDLVYAQHDNPYLLIANVNHLLQAMTTPQSTLPILAEMIASVLHLPYVAIETTHSDQLLHYAFGQASPSTTVIRVPIIYLNKPIGTLRAAARSASQSLSASDVVLLNDVAQQVGIAVRAAQLTADLQGTRERLVIAREEERRRIRNDLHDGLAPTLASLQLQLGAVCKLMRSNPDQAETMASELSEDLRTATAEIRQLVYQLRPPMLDELGLVGAIKAFSFHDSPVSVDVHAPQPLPHISAAVEVAVYRIVREAIHNVGKHADATTCVVCIDLADGCLHLSVTDNGTDAPERFAGGVGVSSMKERAAELGGSFAIHAASAGGTQVVAQFPIAA